MEGKEQPGVKAPEKAEQAPKTSEGGGILRMSKLKKK